MCFDMAASLVAVKQEEGSCKAISIDHALMAESVNFVNLEERILQLCSDSPKGITDEIITQDQPLVDTERRLKALQRLLSQVLTRPCVCIGTCRCDMHVEPHAETTCMHVTDDIRHTGTMCAYTCRGTCACMYIYIYIYIYRATCARRATCQYGVCVLSPFNALHVHVHVYCPI